MGIFDKLFGGRHRQPLEILDDILYEVESYIQPIGNGHKIFPHPVIQVQLAAADDAHWAVLQAAFIQEKRLETSIKQRLQKSGCDTTQLQVLVARAAPDTAEIGRNGYVIELSATPQVIAKTGRLGPQVPPARLEVMDGTAGVSASDITKSPFFIGRTPEVKDTAGRIIRRNDLAFEDDGTHINKTVSREHARIVYVSSEDHFRLCDEGSSKRTSIFRNNQTIQVIANDPRGVALHNGDEIYFGRARVKFSILEETA
ncbi:MAG: FHA domain-containing protein [Acidobacteria bacterium]|nr:FHA domain-containing protein [Acidobacteriota bacterium]